MSLVKCDVCNYRRRQDEKSLLKLIIDTTKFARKYVPREEASCHELELSESRLLTN